jgi:hypothetical protein
LPVHPSVPVEAQRAAASLFVSPLATPIVESARLVLPLVTPTTLRNLSQPAADASGE